MLILAVIVVILQTSLKGFIQKFCKAGILDFITKSQLTIVQRNELLLSFVPSLAFIAKSHFILIAQCNPFSFQKLESYYVLGASEQSKHHKFSSLIRVTPQSMIRWQKSGQFFWLWLLTVAYENFISFKEFVLGIEEFWLIR